jgi:hypothetical protein
MTLVKLTPLLAAAFLTGSVALLPAYGASDSDSAPADDIVVERGGAAKPMTFSERLSWFDHSSFGAVSLLAAGPISAGFGTLINRPREYGTHWEGFGERYGMRMTGVVTSNAMEASLGAIWGEDPRYTRAGTTVSFKARVGKVAKWTFVAPGSNGDLHPAYARYLAISGNNFLSNTWREPSESNISSALIRTAAGFGAHMAGNAFQEFWPDVKMKVFHRGPHN